MKTYSVDQVADTLIDLARKEGISISNLKLQKLMYYAQAWNLVFRGQPLFREEFEAWIHGPVIPQLFRRFKENRWEPITSEVSPVNDKELREHLTKILKAYGRCAASQLEELTHIEEPWREARGNTPADVPSHNVISREIMRTFYTRMAHEKRQERKTAKA